MKAIAFKRNLVIGVIILLVGALGVPSSSLSDLNRGLVGYWSFDNQSDPGHDDSENGSNGVNHGATWVSNGISGGALEFDGDDDYIDLPITGSLEVSPITIAAWINMTTESGGFIYQYMPKGAHWDGRGIIIFATGSGFGCRKGDADYTWDFAHGSTTLSDSTWYHVAWTFNSSSSIFDVYVNGVLDGSETEYDDIVYEDNDGVYNGPPTKKALIGAGMDSKPYEAFEYHFHGLIDEVRIYDRALSDAEILLLYCDYLEVTRGDANGDGKIDIADVVYLVNYLFIDGPAPDPICLGDANCDGKVDIADVVYLVNYLFIGGSPPGC